jgi:hypothetical protein
MSVETIAHRYAAAWIDGDIEQTMAMHTAETVSSRPRTPGSTSWRRPPTEAEPDMTSLLTSPPDGVR